MKRSALILMVVALVIGAAVPAYCDDMGKKLGRGVCNILTCPAEIPEQIKRVSNSDGPAAAMTWGLVKGASMTVVRLVVGVYETLSFPIPYPKDYKPILNDPEFFFEQTMW